jgi:hypothetical protein
MKLREEFHQSVKSDILWKAELIMFEAFVIVRLWKWKQSCSCVGVLWSVKSREIRPEIEKTSQFSAFHVFSEILLLSFSAC